MYVSFPGKLSEVHLHEWMFSSPCGKVLVIVGISWSLDLRVQLMFWIMTPKNRTFSKKDSYRLDVLRPLFNDMSLQMRNLPCSLELDPSLALLVFSGLASDTLGP